MRSTPARICTPSAWCLATKRGQTAAVNLLDVVSHEPTPVAAETLRLLTYEAGAGGLDVLLEIALHRGGSPSHRRAVEAITEPSVISRVPPELKLALELYRADCEAPSELYAQSAARGDSRVFLVLLSQRDRCPKSDARDQAFYRWQRRLQEQRRR
jgi:hypothetical protein